MAVSFHARENGFVHVCGHRGYSSHFPENTLVALEAARKAGATTCEIDVVLTRDAEIVLLHDGMLDRTTTGHGYAADLTAAEIRELDAGTWFGSRFVGTKVPTLTETVQWAKKHNVGIVIEMKERERADLLSQRILEVLRELDGFGNVIALSFNHVDLARIKEKEPRLRTEAIVHARHIDVVAVMRACGADSCSIEFNMFDAEDTLALHEAGICNRVNLPSIAKMAQFWTHGRDPRASLGAWLRQGHIDSLCCDDIAFARKLVDQNPLEKR